MGDGEFGPVLLATARNILPHEEKTLVAVKVRIENYMRFLFLIRHCYIQLLGVSYRHASIGDKTWGQLHV